MDDSDAALVACEGCGGLGFGRGEMTCCAGPMEPVDAADDAIEAPALGDLLTAVFDMSETALDVCLCVMEGGDQTAQALADRIDYDRSVVARHLNHLVDLGVVEKRRQVLDGGGHVYVYSPRPEDVVRRQFRTLFLTWVRSAAGRIDELRREKVESIVEGDEEPQWTVYRRE